MTKHEQALIDLAVQVLREATESNKPEAVRGVLMRLALRVLLPHCPERWPLMNFWDSAQQNNDIGRTQGVTAAFNGIVRQLRASGAYMPPAT